jgi:hypothetical protein
VLGWPSADAIVTNELRIRGGEHPSNQTATPTRDQVLAAQLITPLSCPKK